MTDNGKLICELDTLTVQAECLLQTFLAGEHTLTVVSASGTATANFTVEAANVNSDENQISPKTSDRLNVLFYATVLFISAIGLAGAVVIKKKKSY